MGGFAGGDEGGYWDIDSLDPSLKQHDILTKSKNNLKSYIVTSDLAYSIQVHSKNNSYFSSIPAGEFHETVSFVPATCKTFTIEGCSDTDLELNSIYKSYCALIDFTGDSDITDFFYNHKVVVTKHILMSDDQDGSSAYAAAFMCLAKEICNLVLSTDELAKIASSIDDEIPYFIYNYSSGNL